MDSIESLGIIAGNRSLPLMFAEQARKLGVKRLVAAAFEGETDPALASLVDEIVWLKVGQLSKLISVFTDREVKQCVMVGQIAPKNLYDVRPDLRAMALLLRLKEKNAHTIFGGIAGELKKDGVELIDALPYLTPLMPANDFHIGPKLSDEQKTDVDFGFKIAKEVSRLEIGQIVVVKEGTVLAVEGFEGTDKCLARGGGEGGEIAPRHAVRHSVHRLANARNLRGGGNFRSCAGSGKDFIARAR
jgi:UDP-2,3-diacylglucosamine hydrolase